MDVLIDDKYRLLTEPGKIGIEIQRKITVNPERSPKFNKPGYDGPTVPYAKWQTWKFASTVPNALRIIANQYLHDSSATSLDELAEELKRFSAMIERDLDGKFKAV